MQAADQVAKDRAGASRGARGSWLRWAAWFCFAQTFLLLAVSVRYVAVMGWPEEWIARIFLLLSLVGHSVIIALIPGPVIALVTLVWPRRGPVMGVGIVLAGAVLLALVVDAVVFSLFRFHLNGMVWSLIINGGITEILPLSAHTYTVASLLILGALTLETGVAWMTTRWVRRPNRGGRALTIAVGLVIVTGQCLHIVADARQTTSVTRLVRYLPAYRPLTAKRTMRKLGWMTARQASPAVFKNRTTALAYPRQPVVGTPPATPLNLLVLVIDGWRFDLLDEAITPNLWRFSQRAQRFERHSSAANSTRFGIFTLFYGLAGTYWHAVLGEQRGPVLIHELDRARYQFGAFASARLTSPEFDRTVFVEVRDRITLQTPGQNVPARDIEITRRAVEFIDQRDRSRPFFEFVFYDSTHAYDYPADSPTPFQPVSERIDHLKLNRHTDPAPVRNRFCNAAHFVDSLAARVLARLEQESLLDSTVVIITADHGQEFNDSGRNFWGHNSNFSRFQTRVPLVLHWPGRPPGVVTHETSHLDIAPTLLRDLLQCTTPIGDFSNGRLLWDPEPRVPLLAASWDCFALNSPGRIDVMYNAGPAEHYDEDYRDLATLPSPKLLSQGLEAMSRFYAR